MPVKVFNNMSLHDEVNPENGEQETTIIGSLPTTQADAVTDDDVVLNATTQVTRELTQTDRINKHLLKSFLERINGSGQFMEHFTAPHTPAVTSTVNGDNDDFEEQLFIGAQIM